MNKLSSDSISYLSDTASFILKIIIIKTSKFRPLKENNSQIIETIRD
jgi:hypothetical protein